MGLQRFARSSSGLASVSDHKAYTEADSLYREALRIEKATVPENHPMIAAGYDDIDRYRTAPR